MLHKYIYLIGIFFRNRMIFTCFRELLKTDKFTRNELEIIQKERLSDIVQHAALKSTYYRSLFEKSGIDPAKVRSIEDLKNLKITTKNDLLVHNEEIQNSVSGEKEFLSETSGSTGFPLIFRRNQRWDALHNASVMRGYSWHNVYPWDRNGYLWGYNISGYAAIKTKLLDFIQNRFRLFSYSESEMIIFCKKLQHAKFISGYSSMIYELSKYISTDPALAKKINLAMVKGTSEKIFEAYQDSVIDAFGLPMISEYGAAESGIIAFECPSRKMHLNMESSIIEVIDEEIIVTNLVSHSFPIIRYSLGDYIEIDYSNYCECGRNSPIVVMITGRVGASIQGQKNTYPSLVLYYVFKNLAINHSIELNYQVVQNKRGHLDFRLERKLSKYEKIKLIQEIRKYFSHDMEFSISENERLVNGKGKTKDFVSLI